MYLENVFLRKKLNFLNHDYHVYMYMYVVNYAMKAQHHKNVHFKSKEMYAKSANLILNTAKKKEGTIWEIESSRKIFRLFY